MTDFVLLLFYRHGGAIKSRPGEVQDIVIKNKTVETDREGGREEEENEESAL